MEIITYILSGALEHRDSMGTGSVIRPGDVQRMSAGTGVTHSEANASPTEPVHLLQIWILPRERGIRPSYEQKAFSDEEKRARLRVVASSDARDGSSASSDAASTPPCSRPEEVTHGARRARRWWQSPRGVPKTASPSVKSDGAV